MIANRSVTRSKSDSSRRRSDRANDKSSRIVRYAVVGLGYISQIAVLPAFKNARSNSKLAALVSSDSKKLKSLGRRYGVKTLCGYDEYDDLLRSGEIDAVYIALPNHMHADYTIRAADAGVHVLCEKPMAVTEDECLSMIEAVQRNRVKLMIAYRLHFEESNLKAIETVQSGKIGEPRIFTSTFCMNIKDKTNIRLDREKGGGTLYDIGIYCINAARYLLQAEPTEVFASCVGGSPSLTGDTNSSKRDGRFNEVDEMTAVIMRFPGDRLASFTCSFGASDLASYSVVGTKGDLCAINPYEYAETIEHELTVNDKTKKKSFRQRDQFGPELVYFSDCVLNDAEPEPSGEEGLIDVRLIEALYRSARNGQPERLNVFPPDQRPRPQQEITKPKVRKPKLIHANSPSGK